MRVEVKLGARSYPVIIESGKSPLAHRQISRIQSDRILVVFDAQLYALHGKTILRDLKRAGRPVLLLVLPLDEQTKNGATVSEIQNWMLQERISRPDLILACGGGVTSDIVGYAAATILRGVQWGVIPTTLIGMIDAAIGGKTGVNHPRAKNVIGAFWQPRFVYSYVPFLATLSRRQLLAGTGELIKYAGLIGGDFVNEVDRMLADTTTVTPKQWEKVIARAVAYKASLVSKDERDIGVRQFLNLGHTFAHGIEQSLRYRSLLHGEAVLIGLLAAVKLSGRTINGAERSLQSYQQMVETAISFVPHSKIDLARVQTAMQLDKKRIGTRDQFVLLKRPGNPVILSDIDTSAVRAALAEAVDFYKTHGGKGVTNSHYQRP